MLASPTKPAQSDQLLLVHRLGLEGPSSSSTGLYAPHAASAVGLSALRAPASSHVAAVAGGTSPPRSRTPHHTSLAGAAGRGTLPLVTGGGGGGSTNGASGLFGDGRSPMAPLRDRLRQQHDEAIDAIEAQKRRVALLSEELRERTAREDHASAQQLGVMAREEAALRERFAAVDRAVDESLRVKAGAEAEHTETIKRLRSEKAALETEHEELVAAEGQLHGLLRSIQAHAEDDVRNRERARQEAQRARELFERDRAALSNVESRMHEGPAAASDGGDPTASQAPFHSQHPPPPPYATSSANSVWVAPSQSHPPPPPPSGPPPPPVASAFPSHHQQRDAAVTGFSGAPTHGPNAPVPATSAAEALAAALQSGDVSRFLTLAREHPRALYESHALLHHACAARAPSVEAVGALLAARPELVHAVDNFTGNTPLHFACGAEIVSTGVVDALLGKGASPHVFNKDGLSPFHVALLNPDDHGSALRRHLLFKAGVSVNQPTAHGESPAHVLATSDRNLDALLFLAEHGGAMHGLAHVADAENRRVLVTPTQKAAMYGAAAEKVKKFFSGVR